MLNQQSISLPGKTAARIPTKRDIPAITMKKRLFTLAVLTGLCLQSSVAAELKALADFSGSAVGKSAMQKFPAYMAELMPTLEREIRRAQERVNQPQSSQSQSPNPKPTPTATRR